jgi:phosphomannomutase
MSADTVFKAYDVRGRTDNGEITPDLYRKIGGAFMLLVDADEVAVGRDCRKSSDGLFEALAEGITTAGADVVDLGQVPTDLVYFYSGKHSVPGAMITASHNPPEYNGLKLCRAGAAPVGAETGLEDIKRAVIEGKARRSASHGSLRTVDAIDDYVDHLLDIVDGSTISPLQVAVDGGNGMAGVTLERVFARIDGTFPNHPADPIQPENLRDLIEKVAEGGHDLGVAFDGDADRAFFIDDEAEAVSGSTVTALIARWMLKRHPGASIIHNLITSRAVPETIRAAGGTPIRTRVGHSYIKQVMADSGAVFGGEHSGHYYFADNFRADSGMLAMLILLRVISEAGRPLSVLRAEVETYRASGEINFVVSNTDTAMKRVDAMYPDADKDHVDGLTIDLGNVWFNLRPSNTEPLLRLNVESADEGALESTVNELAATLEEER